MTTPEKPEVRTEWPLSVSRELPSDDTKSETVSAQLQGADPSSSDMPVEHSDQHERAQDTRQNGALSLLAAPAAFRWHAAVLLISLGLPACYFACDGTWTELAWSKFGQGGWGLSLLWSSFSAFHFAWLSQAIVTSIAVALTARLHGRVQSWGVDAWLGLLMRFAIMSVPVSWLLAYLYSRPVLFTVRYLETYDYAMALMTLGWTSILTQGSRFFMACLPAGQLQDFR
eukprot:TRINITY_DN90374_c0_g1_i1.p1 TRINITY_DN90374_c0_g1~~TRINITY_DN90374_c0_g1_i1.p1  ORF type:complete len:250 (-),score=32.64 TRINITY_DN90374_c0_g1_i1:123-806(-)